MKIALGQINVHAGNPEKTLPSMLAMVAEAKRAKADLISFPEMSFGYMVGDNWNIDSYCRWMMSYNQPLYEASRGIAISWGNVFLDEHINERVGDSKFHPNKDGRTRKYNAVYVAQNGKPTTRVRETHILPAGIHTKTLLPTYRMFHDSRHFFSTLDTALDFNVPVESLVQPFALEVEGEGKRHIGVQVCEDMWCKDYRINGESLNVAKILVNNGAEFIVNHSASPWTYGKNAARDNAVRFLREDIGESFVPLLYVNNVGAQNNVDDIIVFDGGSTVYNREGLPIDFAKGFHTEDLMIIDEKDFNRQGRRRIEKSRAAQIYDAHISGLRHVGSGAVVGMSGGIDSSVATALCERAYGKDRVIGVNMPTSMNSSMTMDVAAQQAQHLGIRYGIAPIESLAQQNIALLESLTFNGKKVSLGSPASDKEKLQRGNIYARMRSINVLAPLAALEQMLYTCNGNKVEATVGYFTLDGDGRGGVAPLADTTKTELVAEARYLNDEVYGEEVVPFKVIPDNLWTEREGFIYPTAELEKNQKDWMKFGLHCGYTAAYTDYKRKCALDFGQLFLDGTLHTTLARHFEGLPTVKNPEQYALDLMQRYGVMNADTFIEDLTKFDRSVIWPTFKRGQAPPIIDISKGAWGMDIHEAMLPTWTETTMFKDLAAQILAQGTYIPLKEKA